MAKETAEQKLLKIIESSDDKGGKKSKARRPSGGFNFGQLNLILFIVLVASVGFLILQILAGFSLTATPFTPTASRAGQKIESLAYQPKTVPFDVYSRKIASRNIFMPYKPKVEVETEESPQVNILSQKIAKYKLVGVAWLDLPETVTVMLEDTETGLTHFLKEGDKIDDVTVKTIYVDSVVFSYENEEIIIEL